MLGILSGKWLYSLGFCLLLLLGFWYWHSKQESKVYDEGRASLQAEIDIKNKLARDISDREVIKNQERANVVIKKLHHIIYDKSDSDPEFRLLHDQAADAVNQSGIAPAMPSSGERGE